MDGLIFDSERAGFECWSEVAKTYGFNDITALYRECIGCSRVRVEKLVKGAFGDRPRLVFGQGDGAPPA